MRWKIWLNTKGSKLGAGHSGDRRRRGRRHGNSAPTAQDRREFLWFCQNATDRQLEGIVDKERTAGRTVYARIAASELVSRRVSSRGVSAYGNAKRGGGVRVYMMAYDAPNIGKRYAAVDAPSQDAAWAKLRAKLGRGIKLVAARSARSVEIPSHYQPLPGTGGEIWVPRRFGDRRRAKRNSRGRFTRA